jgi:hypothetical protein
MYYSTPSPVLEFIMAILQQPLLLKQEAFLLKQDKNKNMARFWQGYYSIL